MADSHNNYGQDKNKVYRRESFMEEVKVEPEPIKPGEKVRVNYRGLLAKSGAEQVYLHAGLGEEWNEVRELEMKKTEDNTWSTELEVDTREAVSFCFKDSANNWDNNNGENWTYHVQE